MSVERDEGIHLDPGDELVSLEDDIDGGGDSKLDAATRAKEEALERLQREKDELRREFETFRTDVRTFADSIESDDGDDRDELEESIRAIKAKERAFADQWGNLTAEQQANPKTREMYYNTAQKLQDERAELVAERAIRRREANAPKVDPQVSYAQNIARTEYGDVVGNAKAIAYADAHLRLSKLEGRKGDDISLMRESLQHAREKFQTSARTGDPPDRSAKSRYQAAGRGGGGGGRSEGRQMRMTPQHKAMAEAWGGDKPQFKNDKGKLYQAWARAMNED